MMTVTHAGSSTQRLVGREFELNAIERFLAGACSGGGALIVRGEPGIGKTTLLQRAAQMADEVGYPLAFASGVEFEAQLPYAGLHQLVTSPCFTLDVLPERARGPLLVALGRRSGEVPSILELGSSLLSLLDLSSRERPLIVVVDDLHWFDRSSAAVLSFVARRLADMSVSLIGSSRDGESAFDASGIAELSLRPLDRPAAVQLINDHHAQLSPRNRERILRASAGNPLALLELPTALRNQLGTQVNSDLLPVTDRLRRMYDSRIDRLTPDARHLLLLAALEGTGAFPTLVSAQGPTAFAALAEVEEGDLVVLDARLGLVFRHPLIRSVVVDRAPAHERRAAHAELAAALTHDQDREVWHLSQAITVPDQALSERLASAARRALRRGDGVAAVRTLLRSADLSPSRSDRSRRLAEAAYVGADVTGDLGRVSSLLDEARQHERLSQSLQLASAAAYVELNGRGDVETAYRLLTQSIEVNIDRPIDQEALDEALLILLSVCLWTLDTGRYATFTRLVERLGDEAREELRLEAALIADPARNAFTALPRLDAAIEHLAQETDLVRIERVARAGTYVDRVAKCRDALWRVIEDGRRGGAVATAVNALMHLCADDVRAGMWDEALNLANEGLTLCERYGYALPSWPFRLAQGLVAGARGDYARSAEIAELTLQWAIPRAVHGVRFFGEHVLAASAMSRADWEAAIEHLSRISRPGELPALVAYAIWIPLDLVESLVRAGRWSEARAHVDAIEAADLELISPRQRFLVASCRLWVASDAELSAHYEEVVATSGAHQWPFESARVELGYAERLRRARRTCEARAHLERACQTFSWLGAEPWQARAESELRATGKGVERIGHYDFNELTTREREIAELAAAGLGNKQIGQILHLSPRTVGAHLYRTFPKLGITTRAALRDALGRTEAAGA